MTVNSAPSYFTNTRPEVAALLPDNIKNVLEIGCGEGRFAPQVRPRQSYWGVEPAPAAAEVARAALDRVIVGTFDDAAHDLPDRHFDLIVCNDVIEHMRDHDAFLNDIRSKMTPGGVIVGSIPNVRFLPNLIHIMLQKDWAYQDVGILDRTHLRFFTAKSFLRTVSEHGFAVEVFRGLNSITNGPTFLGRLRWRFYLVLIQLLTLRNQGDTRYLQFGFRIRLNA